MFPESHLSDSHDADLPADLHLLAQQLQGEACQLAECYPAEGRQAGSSHVQEQSPAPRRRWLWALLGGSAAAGLLLPLVWFGLTEPSSNEQADARRHTANVVEADAPPSRMTMPRNDTPHTTVGGTGISGEPMPVYPVGIGLPGSSQHSSQPAAAGLSAPEWEAVLDLTPAQEWEGVELSL